jgi:teichuronic acid biosynthesis glycosyltransferase TuaC
VSGVFHRTLAEALARAGAAVEVVAPMPRIPRAIASRNEKWGKWADYPERYEMGGVVVHRPRHWQLPKDNYLALGRHRSFARCLVESVDAKPDVIHAHFAYPCGLAAARAGATWGIPFVLTLHGGDVNVAPSVNARTRQVFGQAVRRATFLSAVSGALADRTERLAGRRPVILPIGVDLRRYRDLPDPAQARERLGLPRDVPIVLFVGTLLEPKGIHVLKGALRRIGAPRVLGVFVGDGPLRSALAGEEGIRGVGSVPNEQVPLYMRAADVLALPSFSEGMPTVLIEAGAAGLPIVATDVGGIPELLAPDRGLLVPARDEGALVAALRSALEDRGAAQERADRLSEVIRRHYDADVNAGSWLRIYEGLRQAPEAARPDPRSLVASRS